MKEKIIVIGGGISGLNAAEKLSKKYNLLILEKDRILGGLAKSFFYKGKWIPVTYHHVMKVDELTKNYIRRYNLKKYLKWGNIEMAFWFNNKAYPLTKPTHILNFKPFNITDKIMLAKLGIYCRLRKNWNSLRGFRADLWLDKFVGKKVREILFENLAKIKFGQLSSVDAAWFGSRLHEAVKTRENYAYLTCGIQNLITALQKEITQKGGTIKTNAEVLKIKRKTVEAKVNGKKKIFKYDKIISSIPPEILAEISNLPIKIKKELKKIKYKSVISMIVGSKDLISKHYWNVFIKPKLSFGGVFNHTALYPKGGINNEHLYYFFAYVNQQDELFKMSGENIKQKFLKDINAIYPHFEHSWAKIFKIRYATPFFSIDYNNLPIKIYDKIYLTGVYKEHPATRTMNTALRSGIKTANFILNEKI